MEHDSYAEYFAQPRYVVSLQKVNDLGCYKDLCECKTLSEAKEIADKEAAETGRGVFVYDRWEFDNVYRIPSTIQPQVVKVEEPKPAKKKRGRKCQNNSEPKQNE